MSVYIVNKEETMDKQAEESLVKLGADYATDFIEHTNNEKELKKKAEEVIGELGPEKIAFFKEAEAVGRGIAIGQYLAKQGSDLSGEEYDNFYTQTLEAMKTVFGENIPKTAEEIHEGLSKYSQENPENAQVEEVKEKIVEGITPVIVEAMGGEAKLKEEMAKDPEVAQKVIEQIDEVANVVMEDIANAEPEKPTEKESIE